MSNIGSSTKAGRCGFIGQKGIGFKSVYKITDKPEIHSNGFHVRFDISEDKLGMLKPIWIFPNQDGDDSEERPERSNTEFILPLNEYSLGHPETISFSDITPEILLFLRNLRCIKVNDQHLSTRSTVFEVSREDRGDVICLTKRLCDSHYPKVETTEVITYREKLSLKVPRVIEQQGAEVSMEVSETEIAIAFPFELSDPDAPLKPRMVFAFLPVDFYGFNFILQADWILTSARERIDESREWNQHLRENVAPVFVRAFDSFQRRGLKYVSHYFRFFPHQAACKSFFSSHISEVVRMLKQKECIAVRAPDSEEIKWVRPCSAFKADPEVLEVISPAMLYEAHRKYYIHPELQIPDAVLTVLEIHSLQSSDLHRVLAFPKLKETPKLLAQILTLFFSLQKKEKSVTSLDSLRRLKIIPLVGRSDNATSWVNLNENLVFFPREGKNLPFEKNFKFVDPTFLNSLEDPILRSNLNSLLKMIGVKPLGDHEILEHVLHVYSDTPADEAASWDEELLVGYLRFLYYYTEKFPENSPEVYKKLCDPETGAILSNEGGNLVRAGSGVPIHFPQGHAETRWLFVHFNKAWKTIPKLLNEPAMKTFFTKLGVTEFFEVQTRTSTFESQENSPWAKDEPWYDKGQVPSGPITVTDHFCPELEDLITCISKKSAINDPEPGENVLIWLKRLRSNSVPIHEIETILCQTPVMASYSKIQYRLSGVAWEKTPKSMLKMTNLGQSREISYIQFYEERYKEDGKILDSDQPLVSVKTNSSEIFLVPELCCFSQSVKGVREVWNHVIQLISSFDKEWRKYSEFWHAQACVPPARDSLDQPKIIQVESSFAKTMLQNSWWPIAEDIFRTPRGLFLRNDNTEEYVKDGDIYSAVTIRNPKFSENLGITAEITVKNLAQLLFQWSHETRVTSILNMMRIYQKISIHFSQDTAEILNFLREHRVAQFIFLPNSVHEGSFYNAQRSETEGLFYAPQTLCFKDPVNFFDDPIYRLPIKSISKFYENSFYYGTLAFFGIPENPSWKNYEDACNLAPKSIPFDVAVGMYARLFKLWTGKELNYSFEDFRVRSNVIPFPTEKQEWITLSESTHIFVIDDWSLVEIFHDAPTIHFLHPGTVYKAGSKTQFVKEAMALLTNTRIIKCASHVVKRVPEIQTSSVQDGIFLENFEEIVDYAQMWLQKQMSEVYPTKIQQISTILATLNVVKTTKLVVKLVLGEVERGFEVPCFYDQKMLFVAEDLSSQKKEFFQILTKILWGIEIPALAEFLFSVSNMENPMFFCQEFGLSPVPEAERWSSKLPSSLRTITQSSSPTKKPNALEDDDDEKYKTPLRPRKKNDEEIIRVGPSIHHELSPISTPDSTPNSTKMESDPIDFNNAWRTLCDSVDSGSTQKIIEAMERLQSFPLMSRSFLSGTGEGHAQFLDAQRVMQTPLWKTLLEMEGEVGKTALDINNGFLYHLQTEPENPKVMFEGSTAGRGLPQGGYNTVPHTPTSSLPVELRGGDIPTPSRVDPRVEEITLDEEVFRGFPSNPEAYLGDSANAKSVGQLGEYLIFRYLQSAYETVVWVNANGESGKPYDIEATRGGETLYVEVKTTQDSTKKLFEISPNELEMAMKFPRQFVLFIVFLESQKTIKISGLHEKIHRKNLQLYLGIPQ